MWLSMAAVVVAVIALSLAAMRALAKSERLRLRITRLQIAVPDLPPDLDGLKIAFLSDLHVGMMYVPRQAILDALDEFAPDLLVLGGDYAAGKPRVTEAAELVEELAGRQPTAAIVGNTEYYLPWDLDDLTRRLEAVDGRLLRNQAWQVARGDATIEVVGLDSPTYHMTDADAALADCDPDVDLRIALVHSPAAWQDIGRLAAHIALCGHTHGGQVRIPGLEAPVTHPNYPRRLAAGLFRLRTEPRPWAERLASHWDILRNAGPIRADASEGTLMYVSRGVGVSAPQVRLMCPPELVQIEIRPGTSNTPDATGDDSGRGPGS